MPQLCFLILFSFSMLGFGVSVNGRSLSRSLPDVFRILGPEKFFGIVEAFNELDSRTTDAIQMCQGRLTLTSNTPITTSEVSDATTVYFTPYGGNQISLFNGTRWQVVSFVETSVAVPATTVKPFDIFGYNNGGVFALETANWTNDTTRATALVKQDGIYVKSGTTTRRYLGTGRTESDTGEMHDNLMFRFLWNNCNRVPRRMWVDYGSNVCHAYQSATWHSVEADATKRFQVVVGLAESTMQIQINQHFSADNSGDSGEVAVGQDSTSSPHANSIGRLLSAASVADVEGRTSFRIMPTVGFHYYQWLEKTNAAQSGLFCTGNHTSCSGTGTNCGTWTMDGWIDG